ncbi:Ger(x)C family spore germination protein [Bacillus timonensis]|nr:Ger(x)C family spore germination protein [Bacillus timonensis]
MKNALIFLVTAILFSMLFTVGRVEKEIIDDINILTAVGFDKIEDHKIKGTGVIPVFKADKSIENEHFSEVGMIGREIINSLQRKSADPLVTGGIKVSLYSEKLARDGIMEFVDALQRDASIGSKLFLAVVDGDASEILNKNLGNRGTGSYLEVLLRHNMERRDVPTVNLHTFLNRYYAEGMDPFLPYVKLEENKVKVNGLAIFNDEKLVDIVKSEDLFFFKALVEEFGDGGYTIKLKDSGEFASILRIISRKDLTVEHFEKGTPTITIHVYLKGILNEYTGKDIEGKVIEKIIKQMEEEIVQKSEKLIAQFQEKGVDPIGIGYACRTSQRSYEEKQFKEMYPKIEIKVKAKVEIVETGVIE